MIEAKQKSGSGSRPWWIAARHANGLGGDVMMSALVPGLHRESGLKVAVPKTQQRELLFRGDPRVMLAPMNIKPPGHARICAFRADLGALQRRNAMVALLDSLGIAGDVLPQIVLTEQEVQAARERFASPYVAFSLGSHDDTRRVSDAEWRQVFAAMPDVMFHCGAHRQVSRIDAPNVVYDGMMLDLREYAAFVANASAVICTDGALAQLAAAVDTPAVVLHTGHSSPGVFTWPGQVVVAPATWPVCAPCYGKQTCPDRPCARHDPAVVTEALTRLLEQPRPARRPAPERPKREVAATETQTPSGRPHGFVSKAMSLTRAIAGPLVTEDDFKVRLEKCGSCKYGKTQDDKLYCKACGCGKWMLAEMGNKAWFATAECPAGLWPPVDESPEAIARRRPRASLVSHVVKEAVNRVSSALHLKS